MRTAALVLALLGAASSGLTGMFMVGSAFAEVQRVEQAQRLRPHTVTPDVVAMAAAKRNAAIALMVACLAALGGAVFVKRSRVAAVPLLAGAIAPLPFALWALCPTSPLLVAGVLSMASKPKDDDDARE